LGREGETVSPRKKRGHRLVGGACCLTSGREKKRATKEKSPEFQKGESIWPRGRDESEPAWRRFGFSEEEGWLRLGEVLRYHCKSGFWKRENLVFPKRRPVAKKKNGWRTGPGLGGGDKTLRGGEPGRRAGTGSEDLSGGGSGGEKSESASSARGGEAGGVAEKAPASKGRGEGVASSERKEGVGVEHERREEKEYPRRITKKRD